MKLSHQTIQTLSFWDLTQESRTNKVFRLAESGRSMVEMLGVLAIIGVLSVSAVVGYNHATSKHTANTIMSELNLRAVPLSQIRIQNQMAAGTTLHLEIGDKIASGHTISAKVSINPEYFEMTVNGVQQQSCEMILEDYITSSWIMVNNTLYENTTNICNAEENDMTFVYSNNLGERRTCSQKGLFNVNSYKCECDGGTYFDNGKKDCACPAGHIWSETERKCITSRCQEGEFEARTGCVSCDDEQAYNIHDVQSSRNLCEACPNRIANLIYPICINLENCQKTISFPPLHAQSECNLCDDETSSFWLDRHEKSYEYCNACPNRYASNSACILNDFCQNPGSTFIYQDSSHSSGCVECNNSQTYQLGHKDYTHQKVKDLCLACKNSSGVNNREIIEENDTLFCVKKVCDDGEFIGSDGKCYKCTQSQSVIVNENSGCTSLGCGRSETIVNDQRYCALSSCDTTNNENVLLADGSCWKCSTNSIFISTKEECDACGRRSDGEIRRGWIGSADEDVAECRLNPCILGESYYTPSGCSSCDKTAFSGRSDFNKQYCEACGNDWIDQFCYTSDYCQIGAEFISSTSCYSCSYTEKLRLSNHEKHRKMCADCTTTPRFFAKDYCYRCDSNEAPVVTTSEERASCTACPNRQINADNQCVLVKTEE